MRPRILNHLRPTEFSPFLLQKIRIAILDPKMAEFGKGLNWKVVVLEIFSKMNSKIAQFGVLSTKLCAR
ncbi:hypothetical protein LguiA_007552 [Lonicera macranthoides]